MKLKTIFDLLGESMAEVHSTPYADRHFESVLKRAECEAKIAKQMINTADVFLRADKMISRSDRIDDILE